MNYKYILIKSTIGPVKCYGIAISSSTNGEQIILKSYYNICKSKSKVKRLIALCNRNSLSTYHLSEVIDDFVYDL